ncbi:glycosyltransferase family 4 protein [Brevundimonas sp.]|uniref:glycosyltransferase family 4 protein n=1 Tax=Brevundimonas sp. TaxID=1871086 RepID=UPI002D1B26AE|nr:glycosyltransferase family 4 protein [Brevundimonas sp.]HWQ88273.1 glycosyltransferase family 4 protein [Brevundimonas sp.]
MSTRPRVLALAYMVSPKRGSEYAVAWNYIQAMRSHCDLTVLYGCAGPHMGETSDFETATFVDCSADGPVALHFVPQSPLARWLNALNRRGVLPHVFYLAYNIWHRAALTEARRLTAEEPFDLIHFVGPIGYREPGYLWRLPLPYVWGPIGGVTSVPWRFYSVVPFKGRLVLLARAFTNLLQLRVSRRIDAALKRADFLFAATTGNQAVIERLKGVKSTYLAENGIEGTISLNADKFPARPIRIAWIGSLEARKGLVLLLNALAGLRDVHQVQVDIVGDGPMGEQLKRLAATSGIGGRVVWHGRVSRPRVLELLDQAHLHVVTGLNEGNPTSVWEALARSVPVMALDHCGMHDVVQPPYGIPVPVIDPGKTTQAITDALEELIAAPERLEAMARSCAVACDRFRVEHRPAVLLDAYQKAVDRRRESGASR